MIPSKFMIQDGSGHNQELALDCTVYKAAADESMSLPEYIRYKYPTVAGTPDNFSNLMASAGLYLKDADGIRAPTMKAVMGGGMNFDLSGIVRDDGTGTTPSSRLLFPAVVMESLRSELASNNSDYLGGYNSLIANTKSINGPKYEQPVINVTAPEGSAAQPQAQLAEPACMVSITLADTSRRIPTKAIGLTISDEAAATSTLDLVQIAMTSQARAERVRVVDEQLGAMLNGSVDFGETALPSVTMQSFDPTITAAGQMTQTAWIKFLRANYTKMSVTDILMDIDTALVLEARSGKPIISSDDPNSPRIDATFAVSNLGIIRPNVLLLDSGIIGANTMVGLDNRYAIQRVINVAASYDAIEAYVLRRATSFRIDFGEIAHKLMSDAWTKATLTV